MESRQPIQPDFGQGGCSDPVIAATTNHQGSRVKPMPRRGRASSGKTAKCDRRQGWPQTGSAGGCPTMASQLCLQSITVYLCEDQSCPLPATEIDSRTSRGNRLVRVQQKPQPPWWQQMNSVWCCVTHTHTHIYIYMTVGTTSHICAQLCQYACWLAVHGRHESCRCMHPVTAGDALC